MVKPWPHLEADRGHEKTGKIKKSSMFHFFTSHVAKNTWKIPNSSNFVFSRCKMEVSSRQMAASNHSDPRASPSGQKESRLPFACFRPPFCNLKIQNYCSFGFSNCFLQLLLEKSETKNHFWISSISKQIIAWIIGRISGQIIRRVSSNKLNNP